MHIHTYTCRIHIDIIIKKSEDFFKKIYLSLYLKGCVWEGVGDRTNTAIYWPPVLWPSALCLSRSPGLLSRRPGGPICWMLAFSTASCQQRVSKLHRGSWGPLLLGGGFLYHTLSPTGLVSKTNWLPVFTELYNSSIAYSISLEWHVWSSSSGNNCHAVHRSLSSGASVYDCTVGF